MALSVGSALSVSHSMLLLLPSSCSCPEDPNLFSTICNNGGNYSAFLWRLPSAESEDTSLQELIHVRDVHRYYIYAYAC